MSNLRVLSSLTEVCAENIKNDIKLLSKHPSSSKFPPKPTWEAILRVQQEPEAAIQEYHVPSNVEEPLSAQPSQRLEHGSEQQVQDSDLPVHDLAPTHVVRQPQEALSKGEKALQSISRLVEPVLQPMLEVSQGFYPQTYQANRQLSIPRPQQQDSIGTQISEDSARGIERFQQGEIARENGSQPFINTTALQTGMPNYVPFTTHSGVEGQEYSQFVTQRPSNLHMESGPQYHKVR